MTLGARAALDENYFKRMEAIEFAVKYVDGVGARALDEADVILVGVSRTLEDAALDPPATSATRSRTCRS